MKNISSMMITAAALSFLRAPANDEGFDEFDGDAGEFDLETLLEALMGGVNLDEHFPEEHRSAENVEAAIARLRTFLIGEPASLSSIGETITESNVDREIEAETIAVGGRKALADKVETFERMTGTSMAEASAAE